MGVVAFLPMLMPRMPRYFAARTLATSASMPRLLKPMRLMMPSTRGRRNMRGLGLPGCGRSVTVPISICPKPSAASPRCSCSAALMPACGLRALASRAANAASSSTAALPASVLR